MILKELNGQSVIHVMNVHDAAVVCCVHVCTTAVVYIYICVCICIQGPRPAVTNYRSLNAPPVVPEGFDDWSTIMDAWGNKVRMYTYVCVPTRCIQILCHS